MNLDDFDFERCYKFVKPKKDEWLTKHDIQFRITRYLHSHVDRYDFANYYDDTMTIIEVIWEIEMNNRLAMNLDNLDFEEYYEAYRKELNKLEDPNKSEFAKKFAYTRIQNGLWKDLHNDGFTEDEVRDVIYKVQDILIKINSNESR